MGVFEGMDAVWGLLGSSGSSSASGPGCPAWRCSREEPMVVLPPDQPAAALGSVFHLGKERKGWRWRDEPCAAGEFPCKSDCAGEGSMHIGLIWAVLGGDGRGRESRGCQATLPVQWEDKSQNNGKKGSFPRLLFVSLFLRGSSRSDPGCSSREQRDLFVLQRTKRVILGDENWDFWICWGRGPAETGTPGFGRRRDCGKSQFLISGHIPLMYHLLLANICVFALSLSPRKCFVVPALNRAEVGVGLCLD